MFIKSKYSERVICTTGLIGIDLHDEEIEQVQLICIKFIYEGGQLYFCYDTKSDRRKEYAWILSQIDCIVNEDKKQPDKRPEMTTNIDKIVF